jgi:uncharacterized protein YgiB involved in biofilm formation
LLFSEESRCYFSDNILRHCDESGDVSFELTADECLAACNNDADCMKAYHRVEEAVTGDVQVCWMWSEHAIECEWEAANIDHEGATMIWCEDNQDDDKAGIFSEFNTL